MLKSEIIKYNDGNLSCEAYCAYDDAISQKKPLILVCHDWSGRNEFACQKADALATLGYIGFAVDMYGNAKTAQAKEDKMALIQPLLQDRNILKNRIVAAFDAAKKIKSVDSAKIAAIGFCFGGLCALDLARSGAEVKGVVSFHGLLNAPENTNQATIKSKVLVLHGYDDPMVTPDGVLSFAREMTEAKVDWQLFMYGNTMHAFTNPQANDPGFGTVYSKSADARSWLAMKNFFEEIF